jgi:hypothetical protein
MTKQSKPRGGLTAAQEQEALALMRAGASTSTVARQMGGRVSFDTLLRIRKEHDIARHSTKGTKRGPRTAAGGAVGGGTPKTAIYDLDKVLARDVAAIQSTLARMAEQRAVHVAALQKLDIEAAALLQKQAKAVAARGVRAPYATVMQHFAKHVNVPGTATAKRELTEVEAAQVRAALAQGVSGAQLAREFGCSAMCISRIKNNKTYAPR